MTGSAIMLSLLQRQQRGGPARPAQCTGFPPPLAGLSSPRAPKSPRFKSGKTEEESWGEGGGGGTWLMGAFLPPGEDTPRPKDGGVREKASCSPGRLWRAFSWEALPLLEKTFPCILTQEN